MIRKGANNLSDHSHQAKAASLQAQTMNSLATNEDNDMSFWTKHFALAGSNIFSAVRKGDIDKVQALLKRHPDLVSMQDHAGWTPLHYAAHWDHEGVAELLLANKADVNAQEEGGMTPLHCAVAQGYTAMTELLLANKADVNAQDKEGITPLHFAADEGRRDVAELLLLSSDLDANAKDNDGKTPLQWALSKGHVGMAELLRQRGGHDNSKESAARWGQGDPGSCALLFVDCGRAGSASHTNPGPPQRRNGRAFRVKRSLPKNSRKVRKVTAASFAW